VTVAVIRFPGTISKASAFPKLQESWAKKKPKAILADLERYSRYFCCLIEYRDEFAIPDSVSEHVKRLASMPKTTVTWPYVLQLLDALEKEEVSAQQVRDALDVVESFLVRRAIVGLEPTGLHAVFKGLWNKCKANRKLLVENIVTQTIKFPNDDEVLRSLKEEPVDSRVILKYLLIQHEFSLSKKYGFDPADIQKFTIEHVLPQNYVGGWRRRFSKERHRVCVGHIGNLIPLTPSQNSSIKDDDWGKKKKRFKGSNWKTAREICRYPNWTASVIAKRSNGFAKWAVKRWPDWPSVLKVKKKGAE